MPLSPAVDPFSRRRRVADSVLENPATLVDQEIPDVRVTRVARIGELRQIDYLAGDFFFRLFYPLGDVLDDMTIVVARAEGHRGVVPARILTKQLLRCAL